LPDFIPTCSHVLVLSLRAEGELFNSVVSSAASRPAILTSKDKDLSLCVI